MTKVLQEHEFKLWCSATSCSEIILTTPKRRLTKCSKISPNTRDLYDNIIERINRAPETMQQKQGISRISNIFNEYAGITIADRGFQPPEGIRVFKSIGLVRADGTWEPHPTLKPKAKAPPPSSPKLTNRFPPGTDPNDTSGVISPTSHERKEPMNWPMAKMPAGSGKGT